MVQTSFSLSNSKRLVATTSVKLIGGRARSVAGTWLKSGELNEGYISDSEEKITELALEKCSLRLNQPGDVLILAQKVVSKAEGRMMITLDVETTGAVSNVEVSEDTVGTADMENCVTARVRRMHFSPTEKPWRIRFPLVFVHKK